jgi:hypothetical protein
MAQTSDLKPGTQNLRLDLGPSRQPEAGSLP